MFAVFCLKALWLVARKAWSTSHLHVKCLEALLRWHSDATVSVTRDDHQCRIRHFSSLALKAGVGISRFANHQAWGVACLELRWLISCTEFWTESLWYFVIMYFENRLHEYTGRLYASPWLNHVEIWWNVQKCNSAKTLGSPRLNWR